jgi:predicted component of type VI protein secretion system
MVRRLCVLKDPTLVLDELNAAGRAPASAPSLPTAYGGDDGFPLSRHEEPVRSPPSSSVQVLEMPSRGMAAATVVSAAPVPPPAALEPQNSVLPPTRYLNPFDVPQPPPPPAPTGELSLKDIGKRAAMLAEREAILAMLQRTAWNKRRAATKLRISYKALLYKIKECGIVDPRASAEL